MSDFGITQVVGRNVNINYHYSVLAITAHGRPQDSRAGEVLVYDTPVVTVTHRPTERVLFNPDRDANPFFHFFECLWMMAGRADGTFLDRFVRDFSSRFGDEDGFIHGAYGHRWRFWPSEDAEGVIDQVETCVQLLRDNHQDRRVVLQMWDPAIDLAVDARDVPCNTTIYPRVRYNDEGGAVLDLTVCCRSNDIVWGATGANAVHFSFLQEYMASRIGVGVGTMYQLSNNWHAYRSVLDRVGSSSPVDMYAHDLVAPYPIMADPDTWDQELVLFLAEVEEDRTMSGDYQNPFFPLVARRLWDAHVLWRAGERERALNVVQNCVATDWRTAAIAWMMRRMAKREAKS